MIQDIQRAIIKYLRDSGNLVTLAFKDLLENKHLYQSVTIDFTSLSESILKDITKSNHELLAAALQKFSNQTWLSLNQHINSKAQTVIEGQSFEKDEISFRVPDIKTYCSTCDRIEPFAPIHCEEYIYYTPDLLSDPNVIVFEKPTNTDIQTFYWSYRCQSCKETPINFLIRRDQYKIILCGRAPIEHVDVPKFIPKEIKKYYSGAIVAYQSGQTLAGNFMFRCLIEQYVRLVTGNSSIRTDEVIDEYMKSLPVEFTGKFPSFRELYELLSSDIHSATGSVELFDKVNIDIDKHFDGKRVFGL